MIGVRNRNRGISDNEWRFLLLVGLLVVTVRLLFVIDIRILNILTERIEPF
jgi:hypothetical protein